MREGNWVEGILKLIGNREGMKSPLRIVRKSQNYKNSMKRTTSLLWKRWLVPMCPLFGGSSVNKEEDNLSIVDKMAGPNVSFIQRFHCT